MNVVRPCVFCDRLRQAGSGEGLTLYRDRLIHVAHGVEPSARSYLGHLVLQTVRHTEEGLAGLSDEEGARIGRLVAQLSRGLRREFGASWTYTYGFTEGFRHPHQFVTARYPGTPADRVRLEVLDWEGAPRGGRDDVVRWCERFRGAVELRG